MPNLHIVVTGPQGSGKTTLVRHLANNPPEGFKLKHENAVESAPMQEYWILVFEKIKSKKRKV